MSLEDQLDEYRSVALSQSTNRSSFRSETIDVDFPSGATKPVEIRALPRHEYTGAYVPDDMIEELGRSEAVQLTLITKCAFLPGTERRLFKPPQGEKGDGGWGDVNDLRQYPMNSRGAISQMFEAIQYVHGDQLAPPQDVKDPRLVEIAEAAEQLEQIAATQQDLDNEKVEEIAHSIAQWVDHIDANARRFDDGDEGNETAH